MIDKKSQEYLEYREDMRKLYMLMLAPEEFATDEDNLEILRLAIKCEDFEKIHFQFNA